MMNGKKRWLAGAAVLLVLCACWTGFRMASGREVYYAPDLELYEGQLQYDLTAGIDYDPEQYILELVGDGGFDINTLGSYTLRFALVPTGQPGESAEPVESDQPGESAEPVESDQPGESAEPVESDQPGESAEPVEPDQPDESAEPVEPDQPGESAEPVEPDQPGESAEPVEPDQPDESAEPVEPDQPGESAEPVEPDQPGEGPEGLLAFLPVAKAAELPEESPDMGADGGQQKESIYFTRTVRVVEAVVYEDVRIDQGTGDILSGIASQAGEGYTMSIAQGCIFDLNTIDEYEVVYDLYGPGGYLRQFTRYVQVTLPGVTFDAPPLVAEGRFSQQDWLAGITYDQSRYILELLTEPDPLNPEPQRLRYALWEIGGLSQEVALGGEDGEPSQEVPLGGEDGEPSQEPALDGEDEGGAVRRLAAIFGREVTVINEYTVQIQAPDLVIHQERLERGEPINLLEGVTASDETGAPVDPMVIDRSELDAAMGAALGDAPAFLPSGGVNAPGTDDADPAPTPENPIITPEQLAGLEPGVYTIEIAAAHPVSGEVFTVQRTVNIHPKTEGNAVTLTTGAYEFDLSDPANQVPYEINGQVTLTLRGTGVIPYNASVDSGNGIRIRSGSELTLILADGANITVKGKDAVDSSRYDSCSMGGGAAILLPEGARLTIQGGGTLTAIGGAASRGSSVIGRVASEDGLSAAYWSGNGGGGAGAAIGSNGGQGAPGVSLQENASGAKSGLLPASSAAGTGEIEVMAPANVICQDGAAYTAAPGIVTDGSVLCGEGGGGMGCTSAYTHIGGGGGYLSIGGSGGGSGGIIAGLGGTPGRGGGVWNGGGREPGAEGSDGGPAYAGGAQTIKLSSTSGRAVYYGTFAGAYAEIVYDQQHYPGRTEYTITVQQDVTIPQSGDIMGLDSRGVELPPLPQGVTVTICGVQETAADAQSRRQVSFQGPNSVLALPRNSGAHFIIRGIGLNGGSGGYIVANGSRLTIPQSNPAGGSALERVEVSVTGALHLVGGALGTVGSNGACSFTGNSNLTVREGAYGYVVGGNCLLYTGTAGYGSSGFTGNASVIIGGSASAETALGGSLAVSRTGSQNSVQFLHTGNATVALEDEGSAYNLYASNRAGEGMQVIDNVMSGTFQVTLGSSAEEQMGELSGDGAPVSDGAAGLSAAGLSAAGLSADGVSAPMATTLAAAGAGLNAIRTSSGSGTSRTVINITSTRTMASVTNFDELRLYDGVTLTVSGDVLFDAAKYSQIGAVSYGYEGVVSFGTNSTLHLQQDTANRKYVGALETRGSGAKLILKFSTADSSNSVLRVMNTTNTARGLLANPLRLQYENNYIPKNFPVRVVVHHNNFAGVDTRHYTPDPAWLANGNTVYHTTDAGEGTVLLYGGQFRTRNRYQKVDHVTLADALAWLKANWSPGYTNYCEFIVDYNMTHSDFRALLGFNPYTGANPGTLVIQSVTKAPKIARGYQVRAKERAQIQLPYTSNPSQSAAFRIERIILDGNTVDNAAGSGAIAANGSKLTMGADVEYRKWVLIVGGRMIYDNKVFNSSGTEVEWQNNETIHPDLTINGANTTLHLQPCLFHFSEKQGSNAAKAVTGNGKLTVNVNLSKEELDAFNYNVQRMDIFLYALTGNETTLTHSGTMDITITGNHPNVALKGFMGLTNVTMKARSTDAASTNGLINYKVSGTWKLRGNMEEPSTNSGIGGGAEGRAAYVTVTGDWDTSGIMYDFDRLTLKAGVTCTGLTLKHRTSKLGEANSNNNGLVYFENGSTLILGNAVAPAAGRLQSAGKATLKLHRNMPLELHHVMNNTIIAANQPITLSYAGNQVAPQVGDVLLRFTVPGNKVFAQNTERYTPDFYSPNGDTWALSGDTAAGTIYLGRKTISLSQDGQGKQMYFSIKDAVNALKVRNAPNSNYVINVEDTSYSVTQDDANAVYNSGAALPAKSITYSGRAPGGNTKAVLRLDVNQKLSVSNTTTLDYLAFNYVPAQGDPATYAASIYANGNSLTVTDTVEAANFNYLPVLFGGGENRTINSTGSLVLKGGAFAGVFGGGSGGGSITGISITVSGNAVIRGPVWGGGLSSNVTNNVKITADGGHIFPSGGKTNSLLPAAYVKTDQVIIKAGAYGANSTVGSSTVRITGGRMGNAPVRLGVGGAGTSVTGNVLIAVDGANITSDGNGQNVSISAGSFEGTVRGNLSVQLNMTGKSIPILELDAYDVKGTAEFNLDGGTLSVGHIRNFDKLELHSTTVSVTGQLYSDWTGRTPGAAPPDPDSGLFTGELWLTTTGNGARSTLNLGTGNIHAVGSLNVNKGQSGLHHLHIYRDAQQSYPLYISQGTNMTTDKRLTMGIPPLQNPQPNDELLVFTNEANAVEEEYITDASGFAIKKRYGEERVLIFAVPTELTVLQTSVEYTSDHYDSTLDGTGETKMNFHALGYDANGYATNANFMVSAYIDQKAGHNADWASSGGQTIPVDDDGNLYPNTTNFREVPFQKEEPDGTTKTHYRYEFDITSTFKGSDVENKVPTLYYLHIINSMDEVKTIALDIYAPFREQSETVFMDGDGEYTISVGIKDFTHKVAEGMGIVYNNAGVEEIAWSAVRIDKAFVEAKNQAAGTSLTLNSPFSELIDQAMVAGKLGGVTLVPEANAWDTIPWSLTVTKDQLDALKAQGGANAALYIYARDTLGNTREVVCPLSEYQMDVTFPTRVGVVLMKGGVEKTIAPICRIVNNNDRKLQAAVTSVVSGGTGNQLSLVSGQAGYGSTEVDLLLKSAATPEAFQETSLKDIDPGNITLVLGNLSDTSREIPFTFGARYDPGNIITTNSWSMFYLNYRFTLDTTPPAGTGP